MDLMLAGLIAAAVSLFSLGFFLGCIANAPNWDQPVPAHPEPEKPRLRIVPKPTTVFDQDRVG
jgi:hypothetical protein